MTAVDDTFHIRSLDQLRREIDRFAPGTPISENFTPLSKPLTISNGTAPNRLCVQPMEGADGLPDGSPGPLTLRRYTRYARGGFGMLWVEATAVLNEARSNPRQLCIHERNVANYATFVQGIRDAAISQCGRDVILILQLTHSGRASQNAGEPAPVIVQHCPALDRLHGIPATHPLISDDDLDRLQQTYIYCSRLAAQAGFDGVDIKCCHGNLLTELNAAFTRPGKYGCSFENRTRFLLETLAGIGADSPGLLQACRMSACDWVAYPHGFGIDHNDESEGDLTEPLRLAELLRDAGVSLLNVTEGTPGIKHHADEHPLEALKRNVLTAGEIQTVVPGIPVVGGGYSWLRQFVPNVAAGVISEGKASIIGLGRGALAYPEAPNDMLQTGSMQPTQCCILCGACLELFKDGAATGCVVRDNAAYGADYRHRRRFAPDHLKREADRCHSCEGAVCSEACPTHIDVPAFIKAFADDDIGKAYDIIRRSNVLPEICSHLCPVWMQCEGACVETALSGNPIPIRDLQYAVCWMAREEGLVGLRLPAEQTDKRVAIVGGGPTGVSCAVGLLEKGHQVVLFEREQSLGGTPEQLIRPGRFPGGQAEIDAVLTKATEEGLLDIRYGQELGRTIDLGDLTAQYDAVMLAAGIWKEHSLGQAEGVLDALTFLSLAKQGKLRNVPERTAVLAGGDCAMDAASTAAELGASDLFVVYGGSRSEMHWHMPDDWFVKSGAHCLILTEPVGYAVDDNGKLTGLRICRMEYGPGNGSGVRFPSRVTDSESILKVDLVIEAMGLSLPDELRASLDGLTFTDEGLLEIAGAGSFATNRSGVFAAGAIVNGGASVVECIAEGMRAVEEIDLWLGQG